MNPGHALMTCPVSDELKDTKVEKPACPMNARVGPHTGASG